MSLDRDDAAHTMPMPERPPREHGRFLPGVVIRQRYRIVALAGHGGMGEVYRADDVKLGQPVALKFLPVDLEQDAERLQRLLGEVRIARQVSHPNVCRVYDVDDFEGRPFITMEYIDGEDLAGLLRRIGRLPQEKAIDLSQQIASGLAAAHVQGIVHRDLKPANIMLDGRGRARITDFGLAAAAESVRGREALAGTPAYMAPEQRAGGAITARTDVYALGLVMFEMLTGRHGADSAAKTATRGHADDSSTRPSSFVPGLDPAVDTAILRCLEQDPLRRPASAVEVLAALPGGDPLEAAIRAGETPSPEMVAAAGDEGALAPAKSWGLFGAAIASIAVSILIVAGVAGLDRIPLTRSPDVLSDRASDIARQLGDEVAPRTKEWWVDLDEGYADWSFEHPGAVSLAKAQPSALRFNYRQSPGGLTPLGSFTTRRHDPPPSLTGEAFVQLDTEGHLRGFSRLVRQQAITDSVSSGGVDWNRLLAFTGWDPAQFESTAPLWTPDVASDARAAWTGHVDGAPVRIEAAAWKGQPVWLRTLAPWSRPERDAPSYPAAYTGFFFFVLLVILIFGSFGFLVRHNIRLGRGDPRGALRVALAVFVCFALTTLLAFRWTLDPAALWRLMSRFAFLPTLGAWLMYMGVEPFLRRRWPHRLVAWTRMVDGRFLDPLVGREVLIGVVAATAMVAISTLPAMLERGHDIELLVGNLPMRRAADFWAIVTDCLGDGPMKGIGTFAMILLMRVIFRRDALAWTATGLLMVMASLPSSSPSPLQWASVALITAIIMWTARVGVLAVVVAVAISELLTICAPLTLDFSRWYAWETGVVAVLTLAIAFWGFRAAMGRQRMFSAAAFDG